MGDIVRVFIRVGCTEHFFIMAKSNRKLLSGCFWGFGGKNEEKSKN